MPIRFESDYVEGAHPKILQKLVDTNFEQCAGYSTDEHSARAREYIKALCGGRDVDVHFLVGGTQTNLTVICAALRPHQGVISADTGHINCHETGAIEATGHKVLPIPSTDGKIYAPDVRRMVENHLNDPDFEHIVQPGMVYISNPTENGTVYSKAELTAISAVCREYGLFLFADGARLGYALRARDNDVTIADLAELCDCFYIGGTKMGALFGEAVVISAPVLKKDFRYIIKQRGGMLAKGRLLGVQFEAFFEDNLYYEIADHALKLAMMIKDVFARTGHGFYYDSPTNQQFPILTEAEAEELGRDFVFCPWGRLEDGRLCVRFCTSWATSEENVQKLVKAVEVMAQKQ
ncbi:MAG: aminotransferase class I/II-fold pyridoxal phosphate-dependent enzyme [Oscillospiraceae bacterium]|nr:aminotransferase class I/II-fold pyridoxal phosphate-dependent enzyme [Oscillospiraceae bacterium]